MAPFPGYKYVNGEQSLFSPVLPIGNSGRSSVLSTMEILMPRPQHYSPAIERFLVSVLYHEAQHRKIPMTRLVNDLLKAGLVNSAGWRLAMESFQSPGQHSVAGQSE